MTKEQLQDHIYETYFLLRNALWVLGLAFPLVLLGIGWWRDIPLQVSMSAYYYAFFPPTSELRDFPGRAVYVGLLFVFGVFLILYRGFSRTENWALNIAGAAAIVAALFPMETPPYCNNCGGNTYVIVHNVAGVVLFVCMAFVAWACMDETLVHLPPRKRQLFQFLYWLLAAGMIVLPGLVLVMTYLFQVSDQKIFWVEVGGIYVFAAYCWLKSIELWNGKIEKKVMRAEMDDPLIERSSFRQKASRLLDPKKAS
jgi:Protein of unknown function (DUF998)